MAEEVKEVSMGQVKALIRRKLRRIPEHQEQSLNIYPMMDVMTILLVFMIMQFATESANVVQSPELQIPYSTSTTEVAHELTVTISRSEILVEQDQVCDLTRGVVDPSIKQGGGAGFLITPLHRVLIQHRDRLKAIAQLSQGRRPFTGEVMIIADTRTPFRTLSEVIYTLGQAEFSSLHFVVLQNQ